MEIQSVLLLVYYGWSLERGTFCSYQCFVFASLTLLQLLAYALGNMSGVGGYNGWRWIFIIEGLATIVIAVASKFFVVDWPETSKFLCDEERALLLRRLKGDGGEASMNRLDKKGGRRALGDWKIYVG